MHEFGVDCAEDLLETTIKTGKQYRKRRRSIWIKSGINIVTAGYQPSERQKFYIEKAGFQQRKAGE